MYTPAHFRVEDRAAMTAVIRANSFATLVTHGAGGLTASHLPFLYDESAGPHGTLIAHLARANAQWRDFAASAAGGAEALVIFQGEHGYISPTWYLTQPAVPTWNYQAVHAYGVPQIIENPVRVVEVLDATVRLYEKSESPYDTKALPADFVEKMTKAIVAFEIPITRLEGKFKLSQNRSREDQLNVVAMLEKTSDSASHRLAATMRTANKLA